MIVVIEYQEYFKYIALLLFVIAVMYYKFIPENKMKSIIRRFCFDRLYVILYFMVIIMALLVHKIQVDIEVVTLYIIYTIILIYNLDKTKEESFFQMLCMSSIIYMMLMLTVKYIVIAKYVR